MILDEDGYRRLGDMERPVAGDLVLYVDNRNSEMLHVGRILRLRAGVADGSPPIPWVLSKWNSTSGEVMHRAPDVPFSAQGISHRIEFWTDRPNL